MPYVLLCGRPRLNSPQGLLNPVLEVLLRLCNTIVVGQGKDGSDTGKQCRNGDCKGKLEVDDKDTGACV